MCHITSLPRAPNPFSKTAQAEAQKNGLDGEYIFWYRNRMGEERIHVYYSGLNSRPRIVYIMQQVLFVHICTVILAYTVKNGVLQNT